MLKCISVLNFVLWLGVIRFFWGGCWLQTWKVSMPSSPGLLLASKMWWALELTSLFSTITKSYEIFSSRAGFRVLCTCWGVFRTPDEVRSGDKMWSVCTWPQPRMWSEQLIYFDVGQMESYPAGVGSPWRRYLTLIPLSASTRRPLIRAQCLGAWLWKARSGWVLPGMNCSVIRPRGSPCLLSLFPAPLSLFPPYTHCSGSQSCISFSSLHTGKKMEIM